MRIHRKTVWDMESGAVEYDDAYDYDGPVAKCDRAAQSAASNAGTTAQETGAGEGASASGISSTLTPFLTQQLLHPQGYSQQDTTQQLNAAEAGAGGSTSGITGDAALQAARSRNPSGFSSALDEAARDKDKAAASSSEGIAANNAGVKLSQQQDAEKGLSGMYGQDTDAMLKSMGIQTGDINTQLEAGKSGWLQNVMGIMGEISSGGLAAGSILQGMNGRGGGGK